MLYQYKEVINMAVKYIVEEPLKRAYQELKDAGIFDKLAEWGLPTIEEVSYWDKDLSNGIKLVYLVEYNFPKEDEIATLKYTLQCLYNASIGTKGYVRGLRDYPVFDNGIVWGEPVQKRVYSNQNPRRCANGKTLYQLANEYKDFVSYYQLVKRYDAGARTLKELIRGAN
jgi:hypothetical protein